MKLGQLSCLKKTVRARCLVDLTLLCQGPVNIASFVNGRSLSTTRYNASLQCFWRNYTRSVSLKIRVVSDTCTMCGYYGWRHTVWARVHSAQKCPWTMDIKTIPSTRLARSTFTRKTSHAPPPKIWYGPVRQLTYPFRCYNPTRPESAFSARYGSYPGNIWRVIKVDKTFSGVKTGRFADHKPWLSLCHRAPR